jgi:hypothetical protein
MLNSKLRFEIVDCIKAPLTTLLAIAWHQECIRAERTPEDSPFSQDAQIATLRHQKTRTEERCFLVWANYEVVGLATLNLPLIQNTHLSNHAELDYIF